MRWDCLVVGDKVKVGDDGLAGGEEGEDFLAAVRVGEDFGIAVVEDKDIIQELLSFGARPDIDTVLEAAQKSNTGTD